MPSLPVSRDAASAAFFDGAARGEFLLVQDTTTGEYLAPQFDVTADPDRYRSVPSSGRGTVVSWAVVHERAASGTNRRPVGIVELEEGPWWWTELQGADPDEDLMGRAVEVAFEKVGSGEHDETLPFFRVVD